MIKEGLEGFGVNLIRLNRIRKYQIRDRSDGGLILALTGLDNRPSRIEVLGTFEVYTAILDEKYEISFTGYTREEIIESLDEAMEVVRAFIDGQYREIVYLDRHDRERYWEYQTRTGYSTGYPAGVRAAIRKRRPGLRAVTKWDGA